MNQKFILINKKMYGFLTSFTFLFKNFKFLKNISLDRLMINKK